MNTLTLAQLAKMIDHTCLAADATVASFEKLCNEAKEHNVAMVAINSVPVPLCKKLLTGTDVHVGAAISFPLGQTCLEVKEFETVRAINQGADEIDFVLNLTEVKMHNWDYVEKEMQSITNICREHKVICKVIFENCYLTKDEIAKCAEIAKKVKPDFIKTSTGSGPSGAEVDDVRLMKSIVGNDVKVKAAGRIRTWETCKAMIGAGADRIGTSSTLVILEEFKKENENSLY